MKFKKPSRAAILVACIILILAIAAAANMDFLFGTAWHLTHSPTIHYGNSKIVVPKGWFPFERKGSLVLAKYPSDSSIIIFTIEKVPMTRDPKEAMESIGRSFVSAEKFLLDRTEGLKIVTIVQKDRYVVDVLIPDRSLSISYQGLNQNLPAFDRILEGVTFVKAGSAS